MQKMVILALAMAMAFPMQLTLGNNSESGNTLDSQESKVINSDHIDSIGDTTPSSYFIENKGQFPDELEFVADTDFGRVGIGQGKIYYDIVNEVIREYNDPLFDEEILMEHDQAPIINGTTGNVVIYELEGSDDDIPVGQDQLPGVSNYLYGNDRDNWVKGARHFSSVILEDAWDGIDMRYYFKEGSLKYDLILEPGANPKDIRINVEGMESFSVSQGALNLDLGDSRKVSDGGLVTFESGPSIKKVDSTFRKIDANTFGFEISDFDTTRGYVIDPEVDFCVTFGGSDYEYPYDIQVDEDGNIYVMGQTRSNDFPTVSGSYDTTYSGGTQYGDAFVTCIEPSSMTMVYSTYLGGTDEKADYAYFGCVRDDGGLLVYGTTYSIDFPYTPGSYQTTHTSGALFIVELATEGDDLDFGTFFAGNNVYSRGITVDEEDNVIIWGYLTSDTNFPFTDDSYDDHKDGWSDTFIAKLNDDCSELLATTLLGGSDDEQSYSLLIDDDGNYLISGYSKSDDFPTTAGAYQSSHGGGSLDIFIARFTPDLSTLLDGTYIGWDDTDNAICMVFDPDGDIILSGYTNSTNLEISGTLQDEVAGEWDILFIELRSDLSDVTNVAVLGGTENDNPENMVLDVYGNIIIGGRVKSDDFPVTSDAYDETYQGGGSFFKGDSYLAMIDPSFSTLEYSTYLGGDMFDAFGGMCLSNEEMVYACGWTQSTDFPVTDDTFESGGDYEAYIFAISTPGGASGGRQEPLDVTSLKTYSDPEFVNESSIFDLGEKIYIKAEGVDANDSCIDGLRINVSLSKTGTKILKKYLRETDLNSGVYTGYLKLPSNVVYYENITFYPPIKPSMEVTVQVNTPVRLSSIPKSISLQEHEELSFQFENLGWFPDPIWNVTINAGWIVFDEDTLTVSGTPTNSDVGKWNVHINLSDGNDHYTEDSVSVTVTNIPPVIIGEDLLTVMQNEEYYVDYDTDEDDEAGIEWVLVSDVSWLHLDSETGVLNGTPGQSDVGESRVGVIARDGNDGSDHRYFNVTVLEASDPPVIITDDITEITQGDPFQRKYEFFDVDTGDAHVWSLVTNAAWLRLNNVTGVLSGTPGPMDVGVFLVNITVIDSGGLSDSHEFNLRVNNINDAPFFTDVPGDVDVYSGTRFEFDVNGSDYDADTVLVYSVISTPRTDISIDAETGLLVWDASLDVFENEPYRLFVEVSVTDGEFTSKHEFKITVKKTQPPTSALLSPENGMRASYRRPVIEWSGSDPEEEDLSFDVYVGEDQAFVQSRKAETLYISGYEGTSLQLTGLRPGKTYFWTVIPFDGGSFGSCLSGVYSFGLNSPPEVAENGMQEAFAGVEFTLVIDADDKDAGDRTNLRYVLDSGPSGMILDESTGIIKWKPSSGQVMLHKVVVNVSDGIDETIISIVIDVKEGESSSSGSFGLILAVAGISVLVIVGIVVGVFLMMRKRKDPGDDGEEPKEQVIGSFGDEDRSVVSGVKSDVAISTAEAHANLGKGSKQISYEDLYGVPAPKEEEGLTARELKEYISGKITELEKMESREE